MTDVHISISNKTFPSVAQAKQYQAIANLELKLTDGEFVCLVGPSGCGKTTLLNLIAGLDNDYEGSISLGKHKPNATIGYVFQNPRLLPWRTVRENIELALPSYQSTTMIDKLLQTMGLSDMANVYPERLSVGMSRRVSIIRAFSVDPDILLMDEPFVSLDIPTARQVRALLISLWQQRPHTVLFVTHDLREAIALADRLVFLSAAPMCIMREIVVDIPREQRHDEQVNESFRQQLIHKFPEIML